MTGSTVFRAFFSLRFVLGILLLYSMTGCTAMNRSVPLQKPPATVSGHGFIRPVSTPVTSFFGERNLGDGESFHKGVDFGGNWMVTPVFAARGGKVIISARSKTYGQWIEIQHSDGWSTRYCHLTWRHVKKGARVNRGDLIGRIGNSGRSTGSHLHFEVRRNGEPVDPAGVVPL